MILPGIFIAAGLFAEGYCPPGWRQSFREEDEEEVRIHCRPAVSRQEPLAPADPSAEPIELHIRPRGAPRPNATQPLAGARPDTHDVLVRLAKAACEQPGGVSREAWERAYAWFGNGEDLSGGTPADLQPCARALLQELVEQNRSPTAGPFSADWLNSRARALTAPPPVYSPPPRSPETCEGFWSEGRKWICVDP